MAAERRGYDRMIQDSFNAIVSDLDPLVITAPTIRSGTTLLQRLLCSSSRALIYGELCGQDLEFFLNFYAFKSQQYNCRQEEVSSSLRKVLAGDVNDWIPTLMPEIPDYLRAIGRAAFSGISYCRDHAIGLGRPVWGFKHPAWNPATVRLMRALMPRSRFIFIHRELGDCLKSAKAQAVTYGATYSTAEVEEFCRSWSENSEYMFSLDSEPTVLSLQYEDLVREPRKTLARLAEFTGVQDMDPNVLNNKINTWAGEDYVMQSANGYFEPAELSDSDRQIIDATARLPAEQLQAC
jgi:hypothetical protein